MSETQLRHNNKLTVCQFAVLIFCLTAAGPYGIETIVKSGGPLLALIGLCLLPFIYALPQSLMCGELSSMMPSNHGYIIWVYRGLGEFGGFLNGWNQLLSSGFDLPVYPVLMTEYVSIFIHKFTSNNLDWYGRYLIKLIVIILGCILNIFSIKIQGIISYIISLIIILPFLIGFIISIPDINTNVWNNGPPSDNYNIILYLTTLLWLYTGCDVMGCLAGETGFKTSQFMLAFILGNLMSFSSYFIPLIGALTVHYSSNDWKNGYLITAYNKILNGLGYLVVIGGAFSNFALYYVTLSAHIRMIWAISQKYIIIDETGKVLLGNEYFKKITEKNDQNLEENLKENSIKMQKYDVTNLLANENNKNNENNETNENNNNNLRWINVSILPQILGYTYNSTGTPIIALIIYTIINCILVTFTFDFLVETSIIIGCFTYLIEFWAFMALKYKEPNANRPFEVPYGLVGAWTITIVKILLILVIFIFSLIEAPYSFIFALLYNFCGITFYFIKKKYYYLFKKCYEYKMKTKYFKL